MEADGESVVKPLTLWRTVDFFDFVQIIRRKELRIARSDSFSDVNEFVAEGVTAEQLNELLSPFSWKEDTEEYIEKLKTCTFTSCWTRTRDNVAMWEIYSRNFNGVQIEVDFTSLEIQLGIIRGDEDNPLRHKTPPNEGILSYFKIDEGDCIYVDYQDYMRSLKELLDRFEKGSDDALGTTGDLSRWLDYITPFHKEAKLLRSSSRRVKSIAYKHEGEYRFIYMTRVRNDVEWEVAKQHPMVPLYDAHLRATRPDETGPNIYWPFVKLPLN